MSTETGHSDLQALQERQRSRDSLTSLFCHWLGRISPCMSSQSMWARSRVEWSSSPVAMKLGHMVPASVLRQAPTPTQRRVAEARLPLSFAWAERGLGWQGLE